MLLAHILFADVYLFDDLLLDLLSLILIELRTVWLLYILWIGLKLHSLLLLHLAPNPLESLVIVEALSDQLAHRLLERLSQIGPTQAMLELVQIQL